MIVMIYSRMLLADFSTWGISAYLSLHVACAIRASVWYATQDLTGCILGDHNYIGVRHALQLVNHAE